MKSVLLTLATGLVAAACARQADTVSMAQSADQQIRVLKSEDGFKLTHIVESDGSSRWETNFKPVAGYGKIEFEPERAVEGRLATNTSSGNWVVDFTDGRTCRFPVQLETTYFGLGDGRGGVEAVFKYDAYVYLDGSCAVTGGQRTRTLTFYDE